jgi:hypothetical protein
MVVVVVVVIVVAAAAAVVGREDKNRAEIRWRPSLGRMGKQKW